jgi:exosortase K
MEHVMYQIRTNHLSKPMFTMAILAAAYALKRHYSLATANDLEWILRPTAALVSVFSGSAFVKAPAGYASERLHTIIVPACAGVNYLIVVFCTLTFGFAALLERFVPKALFVAASAAVAYGTTVVVNAVRIGLGIAVRHHGAFANVVTPEEAHRILGVAVYLVALWFTHRLADACVRRTSAWQRRLR